MKNKPTPNKEAGNTSIVNGEKNLFENGKLKLPQKPKTAPLRNDNNHRKRKIICIQCHAPRGISKRRLERNLKNFKSEEEFRSQYICRECREDAKNQKKTK
jgi:hypothetical protein